MQFIPLTRNLHAIVSDIDFEYLNQYKWLAIKKTNGFYAARFIQEKGKKKCVYMHRIVHSFSEGLKPKMIIDHKNRNSLDNRRLNLRQITQSENMHNRNLKNSVNRGVVKFIYRYVKKNGLVIEKTRYKASISVNKKRMHLGTFDSPFEAHEAYLAACKKYYPNILAE